MISNIITGIKTLFRVCVDELKATFTDVGMIIFFIIVPLAYPVLYSWIYNNQVVREVPVAVVDMCNSSRSRQFIRNFDASPDVSIVARPANLEEARRMLGKQEAHGILYIPETLDKDIEHGRQATISVFCEMSIMFYYKAVYQTATAVVGEMNSAIQIKAAPTAISERDEQLITHPLEFDEIPIFSPTGGYGDSILPAALVLILHQTLLLGIGMSAGTARENDPQGCIIPRAVRSRSMFSAVLGKFFAYFMIYLVMGSYVLLLVPKMFGWIQILHYWDFALVMLPFLISTIFFGLILSCLIRYRENVMLIVVFMSIPLLFLSGLSWPESAMPAVWRSISYIFPSTFGIRAFVRLNTMGATIADVEKEYIILWVQAFIYFLFACQAYYLQAKLARQTKVKSKEKG